MCYEGVEQVTRMMCKCECLSLLRVERDHKRVGRKVHGWERRVVYIEVVCMRVIDNRGCGEVVCLL